jgi:hypothetical protein
MSKRKRRLLDLLAFDVWFAPMRLGEPVLSEHSRGVVPVCGRSAGGRCAGARGGAVGRPLVRRAPRECSTGRRKLASARRRKEARALEIVY